ncbi:PH domain-containing protein [Herbiconiux sp. CPCC 203407]|uniref:PH domain-containing protein n=1 Tax=Herbiconiux oxytropis TaxID=2970915 RepID=A0AA42BWV4_9MICO|nr:PH domain-containing protein [Herbiconiux oxytropis]MCS5722335.1 PH domain-containing protein [Herbiconiux oxytropis]MCS5727268.1 PH domain-containing protein [Herbiconiux oxytropis]
MSGAPEVAGAGKAGRPDLADGEWHRLHPATPLLRGGIALIAVLGFALANFRERAVELLFGGPVPDDPFQTAYERGHLGWVGLALVVGLLVGIAGFYASWRMHTFRVGDDVVEVRSGILFRTHRRARLDRIQGVSIARPLFARIFGAAKLDISVAGQDAKVQLSYLGSTDADRLRREVLLLASGVQQSEADRTTVAAAADLSATAPGSAAAVAATGQADGIVHQRVRELLAPELDPSAAPPESVVRIPPGRLIGSLVLSGFTVALLVVGAIVVVASVTGRQELLVIILVPGVLAAGGYYFNRFTKSLRYSIAGTSDGVRIGYGLLSTSNDTLPPGRIHAVEVSQPLLWRPAGWWMIRINRAGAAGEASSQTSTTMLPVGTVDDVRRVLGLLLPGLAGEQTRELVLAGLVARKGGGFSAAPRRSWPYQPLSWRRTGSAITADAVLLRSGFVWRHLSIVPFARVQSLRLTRGPLHRALRLSELTVHTVAGPVRSNLPALDAEAADESFEAWARAAVRAAAADTAHRWAAHPQATAPDVQLAQTVAPEAPHADPIPPRPGGDPA